MHQTKKGNQWHFGMKAHIGVDCETGIVHSMTATAANVHDIMEATTCCTVARQWSGETQVIRDRTQAEGETWDWMGLAGGDASGETPGTSILGVMRRCWRIAKASVRAKVEHPFLRLKRLFEYGKVRYRGLAKNTERLALLFGLGNLLAAEGRLRG